jgi:plasmid stabilization system protein ParE
LAKPLVRWSGEAIADLKYIYFNLLKRNSKEASEKIRDDIFQATRAIVFPEQYQFDEIHTKYRRIVIRNYKLLYRIEDKTIRIISVIDSRYDY